MGLNSDEHHGVVSVNVPDQAVRVLTVEEMYDKTSYDLSTMAEGDVFKMLG
jgi:hypothetical protein